MPRFAPYSRPIVGAGPKPPPAPWLGMWDQACWTRSVGREVLDQERGTRRVGHQAFRVNQKATQVIHFSVCMCVVWQGAGADGALLRDAILLTHWGKVTGYSPPRNACHLYDQWPEDCDPDFFAAQQRQRGLPPPLPCYVKGKDMVLPSAVGHVM